MADVRNRRHLRAIERIAYHEAGHAVVAASFGFRFGMLTLYPDAEAETAINGPIQTDLWKCAFPPGQRDRVYQVLSFLWAGTAGEFHYTDRRVPVETDPDRETIVRFLERLRERGKEVPEGWERSPRLNAYALLRQSKHAAALETLAATLLRERVVGHFTARGIINSAIGAPLSVYARGSETG